MASSKGQAPAHGFSPGGSFGHGGHHKVNPIGVGANGPDHMQASNGHTVNHKTSGKV